MVTEKQTAPAIKDSAAPIITQLAAEPQDEDLGLQDLGDGLVIVQNKKGKVVDLYVNGRRVPKDQISKYQDRIDRQLTAAKNAKPLRNKEEIEEAMDRAEASLERLADGTARMAPLPPMPPMPPMHGMAEAPPAPVAPNRLGNPPTPPVPPVTPRPDDEDGLRRFKDSMKRYEDRMQDYHARMEQYHDRQEEFHARQEATHTNRQEAQIRRAAEHALRMKDHEKRQAEHAIRMKEHEKRMVLHNERMKKHEAMMTELKAALAADGLITSPEADYTFKMDKTGLYVNEKKQSEALFQKYKALMQRTTGEDVDLMFKKEGSSFTIRSNNNTSTKK
ncbi:hypothetical protein [Rufibacter sp. LB8]|uniref:hypothetical protein n=1 Tax=Rufibacter sp. LB8 TaxID=2777781 RepID=UPI00178C4593|nr:hypothetical protein [Rufibacter sp. LB8]